MDQAIRHLFGLLERLAPTNKLHSGPGLLIYLEFFGISQCRAIQHRVGETSSEERGVSTITGIHVWSIEGLGPQNFVITYRKTKLAVIESIALFWFIGR